MILEFNPILIVIPVVLFLSGLGLIIYLFLTREKTKIKVDNEFIKNLVSVLGGKDNILSVSSDNDRTRFELKDIELADLDKLRELSSNGVFVTNNIVKTLFQHNAQYITYGINEME